MGKDKIKKGSLISVFTASVLLCISWLFLTIEKAPGHKELKSYLLKQLTIVKPLPIAPNKSRLQSNNVIYVLGGPQDSLKAKFQTAADLCRRGQTKKILLLSESGITEYDVRLQRNLTNTEWAVQQLTSLGVDKEDLEPIRLKKAFSGTLTEAKAISDIATTRGYTHLILITSPEHTMRTQLAFSAFLKDREVNLYIYGSHDRVSLRELLLEYVKLFLYKNVLLPISA